MRLSNMEDNMFAKMLYEKPMCQNKDSIFKKIKTYIKRKNYESTTIKPMVYRLRNTPPSFIVMCEMADFIKIIEKVFFYKNDIRNAKDTGELVTKILSDNKITQDDKKVIILEMQKDMVTMTFTMTKIYNKETDTYNDIINVVLYYAFGRKLLIKFDIINEKIEFESVHDLNLMYNINIILQNAMADLFEQYYKLA